jgi:hypothetical protein
MEFNEITSRINCFNSYVFFSVWKNPSYFLFPYIRESNATEVFLLNKFDREISEQKSKAIKYVYSRRSYMEKQKFC